MANEISKIKLPGSTTEYIVKDNSAITDITRSGTTFTATKRDGTTFTFTQQDNNTTYTLAAGTGDDANKIVLTSSSGTANKITVPYAEKVRVTQGDGQISNYIAWCGTTEGSDVLSANDGLKYIANDGTTTNIGYSLVQIGNNIPSGTTGNRYGGVKIYSQNSGCSELTVADDVTETYSHVLPAVSGTLGVFNATNPITSGQVVVADGTGGAIKTSGYTIATSVPSNAVFTDTTYTLSADTTNNKIKLTSSSGSAQSITVPYATSAGSATSAGKLGSSNVGSATNPIYLNAGTATACAYTLGKSVPSNAVFTDTNTTYTLSADTANNKIKLTPSSGTAQSITVPYATSAGSISVSTVSTSGFYNIPILHGNQFLQHESFKCYFYPGTTSEIGTSRIRLGNDMASGTEGNSGGMLELCSFGGKGWSMLTLAETDGYPSHVLPAQSGTIGVFTSTPTDGQVVVADGTKGGFKTTGYTIAKSVPSNAVFTDTNNAVTQTATSTNANYEVLFSNTADNTTRTEGARKSNAFIFNPTTGLKLGVSSQSAFPTLGIDVHDVRSVNFTPGVLDKGANFFFSNNTMPNSNWWAGLHIKGWTGAYAAWEIVGSAHNNDSRTTPLYVRTSNLASTWGSWRKIYDTSNPPTKSEVGLGNVDNTADANKSVSHATTSGTANTAKAVLTAGGDVIMGTTGSTSDDSGDIIWRYGNGQEKARLWTYTEYTAKGGLNYRVYKKDGTSLYNGTIPLADGTGASGTWGISITGSAGSATTATKARQLGDATIRPTTANTTTYDGALRYFLSSSSMTTAKPMADGGILSMEWDNGGGYTKQLYLGHGGGTSTRMQVRSQAAGTWGSWIPVGVFSQTTPTSGQVVITDGTDGGIKSSGYTIAKSVPSDAVFTDTNTHRPIQVNGTEILGNNTTALNLKAGSNVSVTNSSGTVTIAATNTNTTYTLGVGTGDDANKIVLTPSSGTANKITVPYATSAGGVAWANVTGKPSTFTPASHTHGIGDITWAGNANFTTSASANNQEWSIDLTPGSYTGTYWQIWSSKNSKTILACYTDTNEVKVPNGNFYVTNGEISVGTGIELGMTSNDALSFIDFHWNSINTDWTARIAQRGENTVDLIGKNSSTWGIWRAASFSSQSSKYVKKNIEDITEKEAKKILDLRPIKFDYKDSDVKNQRGLIAEEVLEIMPEMVNVPNGYTEFNPDEPWNTPSIDYSKFVPYLIKMVQIQQKEIDKLKGIARINPDGLIQ